MIEVNVTRFFRMGDSLMDFAASRMELGDNAGSITWNNAVEWAKEHPRSFRGVAFSDLVDHFAGYGAWERSNLEERSLVELKALLVQDVAGSLRAYREYYMPNLAKYYEQGGRCYRTEKGQWYFTLGI